MCASNSTPSRGFGAAKAKHVLRFLQAARGSTRRATLIMCQLRPIQRFAHVSWRTIQVANTQAANTQVANNLETLMREEERLLLQAIEGAKASGRKAAIATVVRVVGSAYRREGTKMLIDADGGQVCMISGGCLEQEVGEIAKQVMESGQGVVHFFDLDEEVVWGLGLGCGGAVDVYIEPLDSGEEFKLWLETVQAQKAGALATILNVKEGSHFQKASRLFIAEDGSVSGSLGFDSLNEQVVQRAKEKMSQLYPRSETRTYKAKDEAVEVFLDVSVPPPELAIFGAGHDAIPLASYANKLGFRVTVIDARHAFVTSERFPTAHLIRTHPSGFADKVSLTPRTYVVLMNHHLERDKESLAFALTANVPYIGVLGPRSRYERMLNALKDEGRMPSAKDLAVVRNPVGVDIGADTPDEIAVSVMSELIAIRGNYKAGFLNERAGRIHAEPQTV
jgi:xanthine dehydrogenase accessory factor